MSNRRQSHQRSSNPLTKVPTVGKPHAIMRHVVARGGDDGKGRDYYLHATKGYRSRKA